MSDRNHKLFSVKRLILIIILAALFVHQAVAQQDSIPRKYSMSGKSPNIINLQDQVVEGFNFWEEDFRGHWSGIFFGVNGLANADYSAYPTDEQDFLDVKLLRSSLLDINLFQISKGLQRNRNNIGFVTGLGMEIQTYYLDRNTSIIKGPTRVEPDKQYLDANQKSKLASTYLSVPVLLEFQIPVKRYENPVYFSAGVTVHKRLSTHTKIKYRENNQKQKLKTPDDFYMTDFRYAATIRMGYRWVNIFATYDLRPLFEKDKGPEVYPFSVGVALISF